jgi:hypothetical protein
MAVPTVNSIRLCSDHEFRSRLLYDGHSKLGNGQGWFPVAGAVLIRAGSLFGSRSQSGGYKVIYFAGLSGKGGHQPDENFIFCRRRAFGGEIAKSPRIVERSARFQRCVDLAGQNRKNFIHLAGPGHPDARDLGQALSEPSRMAIRPRRQIEPMTVLKVGGHLRAEKSSFR